MNKPTTRDGYDVRMTETCERVLVTLLSGLGPWKDSVYLIGGLVPRYLVPERPPGTSAHAGTSDVDVVVELEMLANTDAYRTLQWCLIITARRKSEPSCSAGMVLPLRDSGMLISSASPA